MKFELIGIGLAVAGIAGVLISQEEHQGRRELPNDSRSKVDPTPTRFSLPPLSEVKLQPMARELEELHSEGSFPQDDVDLLGILLRQHRRAFGENPVGLNEEIVAVLAGRNSRGTALISPEHPAIDHQGRLLDRWGTPYFFHQSSGVTTEVVSAGPDRQLFTDDDDSSDEQDG
jgi:hypothetical protein